VLQEYEFGPEFAADVRRKETFKRSDLAAEHRRRLVDRRLEFGLPGQAVLVSDALGQNAAIMGMPVPFHLLGMPTLVPAVEAGIPELNKQWPGQVVLGYGFGRFTVKYSTRLSAIPLPEVSYSTALEKTRPWARGENTLLIMEPEGAWEVRADVRDQGVIHSGGHFVLSVHTKWIEDGKQLDAEIGRCDCEFEFQRVPVAFDEQTIFPAAWAAELKRPKPGN
jgi:hypothetical protein